VPFLRYRLFLSALSQLKKRKEVGVMDVRGTVLSIAQQLAESLNAERCTIRVPEGEKMKLMAVYGINAELRKEEVDIVGTIAGEAFTTGQIQNILDITKDDRYDPGYIIHNGHKALLAIPLQFEGNILGVAQVYAREPFSSKQIAWAQILSQFAALILSYEQFRRASGKAILKVIKAIIEGNTFGEIARRATEQITQNLQIKSCVIYRIFDKDGQQWCEIAAGVPSGEHGIGLKEELNKHPDIQAIVDSQKITIDDDPQNNPLTLRFREIIRTRKINQILYIPITKEIVLVVNATEEKNSFGTEEIDFCFNVGQILSFVFGRIQADLQEWRHQTINPVASIGISAKRISERISELIKILNEEVQKLQQNIPEKF